MRVWFSSRDGEVRRGGSDEVFHTWRYVNIKRGQKWQQVLQEGLKRNGYEIDEDFYKQSAKVEAERSGRPIPSPFEKFLEDQAVTIAPRKGVRRHGLLKSDDDDWTIGFSFNSPEEASHELIQELESSYA